jgi:hypothetical protein
LECIAIFKPPEYLKPEYSKKGKDRHWLVVRIKHGLERKKQTQIRQPKWYR